MTKEEILVFSYNAIELIADRNLIFNHFLYIFDSTLTVKVDNEFTDEMEADACFSPCNLTIYINSDIINKFTSKIEEQLGILVYFLLHEMRHLIQYIVLNILVANAEDALKIVSWSSKNGKYDKLELDAILSTDCENYSQSVNLYDYVFELIEEYEFYNED